MSETRPDGQNDFLRFCSQLESQNEFVQWFDLFFTAQERHAMGHRYLIIKELLSGERTQREIAADFNVSIAKITRGSNMLKSMPKAFIRLLKRQMKDDS